MHLAVLGVAMAPQEQLFQHEEAEDSAEHRDRHLVRIARLECLRKNLEERRAEQRADRERYEHRHPGCAQRKRRGGEAGAERPAREARGEDPGERHGGSDSTPACRSASPYANHMNAPMRAPVRSRRYEKNRSGSEYVHDPPPNSFVTPAALSR